MCVSRTHVRQGDSSGQVTKSEVTDSELKRLFRLLDANHSGVLDVAEIEQFLLDG